VRTDEQLNAVVARFGRTHPGHVDRLRYIYGAQKRFATMLDAWTKGDVDTIGRVFREDGRGLRDQYQISGPELESICDIVRTVPGM